MYVLVYCVCMCVIIMCIAINNILEVHARLLLCELSGDILHLYHTYFCAYTPNSISTCTMSCVYAFIHHINRDSVVDDMQYTP